MKAVLPAPARPSLEPRLPAGVEVDRFADHDQANAMIADYAVMGMPVAAERFDEVVRIAARHEWTQAPPGRVELLATSARSSIWTRGIRRSTGKLFHLPAGWKMMASRAVAR